jgi:hypothetical protein
MVAGALKVPVDVVLMGNVVEPMITFPDVEALKPLPVTVIEDPAGPLVGLSDILPVAA